jgi:hypothetical protein
VGESVAAANGCVSEANGCVSVTAGAPQAVMMIDKVRMTMTITLKDIFIILPPDRLP